MNLPRSTPFHFSRQRVKAISASRLPPLWRRHALPLVTLLAILILCYHSWLQAGYITAGDFPYFTLAHLRDSWPAPTLWNGGTAVGGYDILDAPSFAIVFLQGVLASLGLDWAVSERLLWIAPATLIPAAATYGLSYTILKRRSVAVVSAVAATANSYVYLLYQGGQFGVATAAGFLPLILWSFLYGQRKKTFVAYFITGLCMSVQAMYDIRSTYFATGILLFYLLVQGAREPAAEKEARLRTARMRGVAQLVVAVMTVGLVHLWWIVPSLLVRLPALPTSYVSVAGVQPLSIMHIANGLALAHPFWPLNDGHLYPTQPIFFLAPLAVFSLLLVRRSRLDRTVFFLTVLALVSIFLVNGDNGPVGEVYDFLFTHAPGFSAYRDPSKFYQPLFVAYSLLLGYAMLPGLLLEQSRRLVRGLVVLAMLFIALYPASPALLGEGGGTFTVKAAPVAYAYVDALVQRSNAFSRVLWLPVRPRFAGASFMHPAMNLEDVNACCGGRALNPWQWLLSSNARRIVANLSIGTIVTPNAIDPNDVTAQTVDAPPPGSIDVLVRKALPTYKETVVGDLHVFTVQVSRPLLFASALTTLDAIRCHQGLACRGRTQDVGLDQVAVSAASASAQVRLTSKHPTLVVWEEAYNAQWQAFVLPENDHNPLALWSATSLDHVKVDNYANGWIVHGIGRHQIVISYRPQRFMYTGVLATVGVGIIMLIIFCLHRRFHFRLRTRAFPNS